MAEFTTAEIVQLGKEIYDRDVRALLESLPGNMSVAIDVRTGEFEIGETGIECADKLRARIPHTVIFFRQRYPRYARRLFTNGASAVRHIYS